MESPARESQPSPPPAADALSGRELLALLLGFGALTFVVYRAVLPGRFVSDDALFYALNPVTAQLSLEHLWLLCDPTSWAHLYSNNYAPVHLLLVTLERWLFGASMPAYHAVNLLLHALNAVLLVVLLQASRIPRVAAILGGTVFLLHPAQVEAVAWISQLKSVASLGLGLCAVLCLWRRPAASAALFGLALLAKFAALAFLPMAAVLAWVRRSPRSTWAWLSVWLVLLALVASAQLVVFGQGGSHELEVFADRFEQLRTMLAIGARYLWMAATGLGLSAFHDPEPARSLLDGYWLAGLLATVVLTWRLVATLLRREEEAAWWVLAAAAFVPVSQLVPFRFPVGDRYLYFILPGLIGGAWLSALALRRRIEVRGGSPAAARLLSRGAAVGIVLVAGWFGFQALSRVPLWLSDRAPIAESARSYPDGAMGYYLRAVTAAEHGDVQTAVAELRELEERSRYSLVKDYAADPWLAYVRSDPRFQEFLRENARFRIEWMRSRGLRPGEQAQLAMSHATLGEYDVAIGLLEELIRGGDHRQAQLLAVIGELRAQRKAAEKAPRSGAANPGAG